MHFEIPHTFSKQEAVGRVTEALAKSHAQLLEHVPDLTTDWQGERLNFAGTLQGAHIIGTVDVEDNQFVVDAKLPLMWRMFEGRIEKAIQEQVAQAL